jgi:hypothetical protein
MGEQQRRDTVLSNPFSEPEPFKKRIISASLTIEQRRAFDERLVFTDNGGRTMSDELEPIIEKAFEQICETEPLGSISRSDIRQWLELLLPLLADHDRRIKTEAWEEGRESLVLDMIKPLDANGQRNSTPNPYRGDSE